MRPLSEIPSESAQPKWSQTLTQFLELARQAADEFDYERALKHLSSMEELWEGKGLPTFSLELRYNLHNEKGKVLAKLGRYNEAVEEYQKLLEYCQDKKLFPRKVEVFLEIGQLLAKMGEHDRALGYVHRALSGYRRLADFPGVCKALRNLGVIYIELGEFEDAETAYEEAIEIAQENELNLLYADLINNLGTIKNIKGDWKAALECYTTSREVYEQEKEIRKSAYTSNNIGITLIEQEQYQNAREYFLKALKVAGTIKDQSLMLILYINLTDLSIKVDAVDDARSYCRAAEKYINEKGLKNSQLVETKKLAGKIAALDHDYEEAEKLFDRALALCEELGLQYMEAEVLFEKGSLYLETEQHMEALQALEQAFQIFHQLDAAGRLEKTEGLIYSVEELYLKVFESMAAKVDRKDPYTKGHSDRVANLALHLAQKLRLPDHEIKTIVAGALLHDIGKLRVPDEILKKTGKLDKEEFDEIKKHPENAVQLLSGIRLPWDVMPVIRHHHEKFEGNGYPSGVSGEVIPFGARIVCVADVFDALTSDRPYREAFSPEKAIAVMKEHMQGTFDPVILDNFVELMKSGTIDHIINRRTDSDEMYKIWAQCRITPDKIPADETETVSQSVEL